MSIFNFVEVFIAICIIVLIVPQTPDKNRILRNFLDTGLFTDYAEAKFFLTAITWFLILSFLLLTFFLNFN